MVVASLDLKGRMLGSGGPEVYRGVSGCAKRLIPLFRVRLDVVSDTCDDSRHKDLFLFVFYGLTRESQLPGGPIC